MIRGTRSIVLQDYLDSKGKLPDHLSLALMMHVTSSSGDYCIYFFWPVFLFIDLCFFLLICVSFYWPMFLFTDLCLFYWPVFLFTDLCLFHSPVFLFTDLCFFIDHLSLALMVQATSSSGDYCTCQQYICYFCHLDCSTQ